LAGILLASCKVHYPFIIKNLMKIAILSRDAELYSTSRLVEEGESRGHKVAVLDPLDCTLVLEQKKPMIRYKGELLPKFDAIIPRIGCSATFYASAVIRQFEVMKTFTTISSVSLIRTRDKLSCIQALTKAGVELPKTVFTNYSDDIPSMVEAVGGSPIIIKLLDDADGHGGVLAESTLAAASIIEAFNGLKARMIVQEYITEAAGQDLLAFVVKGKVVGAIQRHRKISYGKTRLIREHSSEKTELSAEEKTAAIRAAAALRLSVASVQMLRSRRGPLVLEVNSSPSMRSIEDLTKYNVAGAIYDFVEKGEPMASVTTSKTQTRV
jgi:ribosomal protein S6--L-glutamate ligase